jgi:hypothetical protein
MRSSLLASVAKPLLPLLAFFMCGSLEVRASPAEEAAAKLAGQSSYEWVFKAWRRMMGADPTCIGGKSYRFSSDNSLKVQECVGGKIKEATKKWSIEESGLDLVIKIDGDPYVLLFKDAGEDHLMLLRKSSDSKLNPTVDEIYRRLRTKRMKEDRKRNWDVGLGIVAPLVTVATVLVGVWQFTAGERNRVRLEQSLVQKKDDLDFARRLWLERMKQYRAVAELAGKIVANLEEDKKKELMREFDAAYYGAMILVEDRDVEKAMVDFRVALKDFDEGWIGVDRLKLRADELIKACRKSIEKGGPKPSI